MPLLKRQVSTGETHCEVSAKIKLFSTSAKETAQLPPIKLHVRFSYRKLCRGPTKETVMLMTALYPVTRTRELLLKNGSSKACLIHRQKKVSKKAVLFNT
jgi:hypothetical protein